MSYIAKRINPFQIPIAREITSFQEWLAMRRNVSVFNRNEDPPPDQFI